MEFLSLAAPFLACITHVSVTAEEDPKHPTKKRKKRVGTWRTESFDGDTAVTTNTLQLMLCPRTTALMRVPAGR